MKVSIIVFVALVAAVTAFDSCGAYPDCQDCVSHSKCGWCSDPVLYQNGTKGARCAGFNSPTNSTPFVCTGVYSTGQCVSGYKCDTKKYQCVKTLPGQGEPLAKCQANCTTTGKTFVCDPTNHTCVIANAGHGKAHDVCMKECAPPTSSPNPSHPHHSVHPHSSHPQSHSPTSSPAASTYACNHTTWTCDKATVGHGSSKSVCEASCKKPTPKPGPPTDLVGVWRGIQIQLGYEQGESDLDLEKDGNVKIFGYGNLITGTVVTVGDELDFTLKGDSGVVKCLYQVGQTQPEVRTLLMACGEAGKAAPATVADGMKGKSAGFFVIQYYQCVAGDDSCVFNFGDSLKKTVVHRTAENDNLSIFKTMLTANIDPPVTDHCSQYGDSCADCISHQYCGWCSRPVIYTDGQTGTRCAGFNGVDKKPFTCTGTYSTEMCLAGYVCNATTQSCNLGQPGQGTPKDQCDASCKAHKKTPVDLIGVWRGLMINQKYLFGEFDFNITATQFIEKFNGSVIFTADVATIGADLLLTETSPTAGNVYTAIRASGTNGVVDFLTLAAGAPNGPAPADFKKAMVPPMHEMILAKCAGANCKFNF